MTSSASAAAEDFFSLFSFLPIGAYRSSPDGRMYRANPALVKLNGYDSEVEMLENVNRIASDWYVQAGRRAEFRQQLARDGFVRGFVSEVERHHGGQRLWVSENAHCVRDDRGEVAYYEGTVEDITEAVQTQEAVRRSEAQMRLIAAQVPGMVFAVHVDPDGNRSYRFVSDGARDIYGFEPEALMQDPMLITRYWHPDDTSVLERGLEGIRKGVTDLGGEFRVVWPDGQVKWVLWRSSAVSSDETGQLRVGVVIDITERRQAEVALHESEARWKLALESTGDGVWDWNLVTGKEYLSRSMRAMFGFGDEASKDLPLELDQRTHPDDVAQMLADRQAHFEGRLPVYRNEHRIRCRDGHWKWVLSRGMVIQRDEDGRPQRMVGTHTDITEIRHAEAQQRALEAQLRESQKMEAIGTLAGGVAHDFNNLLAAILGNLALAREDVGEDHVAQESLAEINRAAIRARQLVQQILAFSRRQAQEMQRQWLTPLVEEALGLLRSLLPAGVRLETRLSSDRLPVLADATQMQQVLMNLCTNAWQAMVGRSGEITVVLEVTHLGASQALRLGNVPAGAYARLSVADNGPGMDAETQRRIFEPFFTTKAPGTGTGLGLAVVHGIVKAHRGAIEVHSRPGEGARFDVYLPLAPGAEAEPQPLPQTPGSSVPAGEASGGRHVVYIDDYEAMVFLVGRLLRKQGYRVSTFGSGEAALAWLRGHPDDPVDLLVTDQNMPGLSGIDVVRELRTLRPSLRIAIVSGHVNEGLIAEASALGVTDVLGKQDSMDALGDAIRALMPLPGAT